MTVTAHLSISTGQTLPFQRITQLVTEISTLISEQYFLICYTPCSSPKVNMKPFKILLIRRLNVSCMLERWLAR